MQDQSQDQVQFDLGIALGPALGPATMCINANGRGNGWLKTIWLIYKLAKLYATVAVLMHRDVT